MNPKNLDLIVPSLSLELHLMEHAMVKDQVKMDYSGGKDQLPSWSSKRRKFRAQALRTNLQMDSQGAAPVRLLGFTWITTMNVGSGEILDSSPCSICFGRILFEIVSFVLPGGTLEALRALDFFIFRV